MPLFFIIHLLLCSLVHCNFSEDETVYETPTACSLQEPSNLSNSIRVQALMQSILQHGQATSSTLPSMSIAISCTELPKHLRTTGSDLILMPIAAKPRIAHKMTREAAGAEADHYATRPYATSTLYFGLRTSNIGTV